MPWKLLLRSGSGAGEEIAIPAKGLVIGRDESCDICIADRSASREHCRIELRGAQAFVKDLGSKNGTQLNGLPVEDSALAPGDVVQVGGTAFQALPADEPGPGETQVRLLPDEDRKETLSLPRVGGPEKASEAAGRLTAAFRMAGLLAASLPWRELLERFLDTLLAQTSASRAAFLLFEGDPPAATAQVVRASGGRPPARVSLGEGMVRKALHNGESLLYQNLALDPSWPEAASAASLFYSAICAPLPSPSGVRGVAYLDTIAGEGELNEKDLQLAAVAGALAGSILENDARLRALRAGDEGGAAADPRHALLGSSLAMKRVYEIIRRAAPASSTVLIRGESGTGKELVARAIHRGGPRRGGPFVAVNCAAIPAGLLESELFGYEKGAFTGASRRTPGRFEAASGGILFLDEIGDLPLESQVKILRALEEKAVVRLGSSKPLAVDIRLLAATNQDLEKAVREGRFRQDLFFRLQVIVIDLPPLRDRPEDVPVLVDHFLESFRDDLGHAVSGVAPEALALLKRYAWPGNVRELRNTVERALVLARGTVLGPADISFLNVAAGAAAAPEADVLPLREMEARHVRRALQACGGNKTQAAKILGIERSTLYEKMKAYGIGGAEG
jgi:DNA-binding NtrC family response regulator/pSer/pThr/pTyr-binding forkhead associated (FHA) protein